MIARKSILKHMLRASALGLSLFGALLVADVAAPQQGLMVQQAQAEPTRAMSLALNKSAVVRLPAGVKDILVGNPEVADVVLRSKRTMYVFARKLGGTNIFLLDASGRPLARIDLAVVLNPTGLQRLLKKALPNANITVETMENQILLSGSAKTPAEVNKAMQIAQSYAASIGSKVIAGGGDGDKGGMKVVNAIRITGKDQVMIKVRLAEVQRDVLKQLRTNFSQINFSKGNLTGIVGLLFPFSAGSGLSGDGVQLDYTGKNVQGSALLQALERDGMMRLLAEPTLTAISGEAAKFMAGGEVPVITGYDKDTNTYTYEHKPFGVMLGFRPVVLSEARISLQVNVEVSDLSSKYALQIGSSSIPGFAKRQVATTVELPSGGTLALAGMFKEDTRQSIDGVPGVKNLPILGALFRSRDFVSNQTELVVLATPYIVTPRNEKKFRTPVDRLNIASDYQTYFLGRLHRVYGAPGGSRGGEKVYHGNVGFIVE